MATIRRMDNGMIAIGTVLALYSIGVASLDTIAHQRGHYNLVDCESYHRQYIGLHT
jgi:hypothetical protein